MSMRPGAIAAVVGIRDVETPSQATQFETPVGSKVYLKQAHRTGSEKPMDALQIEIPSKFITERASTRWRELLFGLDNGLLSLDAAFEIASKRAAKKWSDSDAAALGGDRPNVWAIGHIQQLAQAEMPTSDDDASIRSKWLYLVLAWAYEQREILPDPLGIVEAAYADFGYPEELEGFVRYMPTDGTGLGTPELNRDRLFYRWRAFIERTRPAYDVEVNTSRASP